MANFSQEFLTTPTGPCEKSAPGEANLAKTAVAVVNPVKNGEKLAVLQGPTAMEEGAAEKRTLGPVLSDELALNPAKSPKIQAAEASMVEPNLGEIPGVGKTPSNPAVCGPRPADAGNASPHDEAPDAPTGEP